MGDSLDHTGLAREDERMKKLALILLFACAACTSQAHDPKPPQPAPAAAQVAASGANALDDIRRLIGSASCSDSSQCRTLPVGARACGGPQEYLPWSTLKTDERALTSVAERYKAERQSQIKSSGEMSTCRFMPDPGAVCVAGACQLGAAAPGV